MALFCVRSLIGPTLLGKAFYTITPRSLEPTLSQRTAGFLDRVQRTEQFQRFRLDVPQMINQPPNSHQRLKRSISINIRGIANSTPPRKRISRLSRSQSSCLCLFASSLAISSACSRSDFSKEYGPGSGSPQCGQ